MNIHQYREVMMRAENDCQAEELPPEEELVREEAKRRQSVVASILEDILQRVWIPVDSLGDEVKQGKVGVENNG